MNKRRNFWKYVVVFIIVILSIMAVDGCKKMEGQNNGEEQFSQSAITPNHLPNQKTYHVHVAEIAPTIDGIVSEGEYGEALAVYNYDDGLTRNGDILDESDMKNYVSKDWTMYITYDQTNIYFAFTCIDEDYDTEATTAGYQIWNGDSIEIDLWKYVDSWDEFNIENRIRYISGRAQDATYWGGWAAVADYITADAVVREELSGGKECYAVARYGSTFVYEVKFTWEEATGSIEPVDRMFFYAQLATDSSVYFADKPGAQFWWRNVIPFTEDEQAKVDKASGTAGKYIYAFPILEFVDYEVIQNGGV